MTEPTELLPCPFCGSHALLDAHADDCYFTLHSRLKGSGGDASLVLEAHAAWNRRTPAPVGVEPVEKFDNPLVQAVYAILCDDTDWPPKETPQQHWEGWIARRIVDQVLAMGRESLTDEQIDLVAAAMPGGLSGFLKSWGYRQFAREILALRAMPTWEPEFDCMTPGQEELAIQFCQEIAGRRGESGSPPDPVRLLDMAQALYKAERAAAHGITAAPKGGQHGAE